MADWSSFPFTYDGVTRDVFTMPAQGLQPGAPGGQGVLVMHELGGITRRTEEFAAGLTQQSHDHNGFDVFVPAMFGRFRQGLNVPFKLLKNVDGLVQTMCVRAEFRSMQTDSSSPIAEWMRALAREIGTRTGGPIGVVGMCLTGGVVFSMVWDPAVGAVVAAQPSLPMFGERSRTTVSKADFEASTDRIKRIHDGGDTRRRAQLHHFDGDFICPPSRVVELRAAWDSQTGTPLDVKKYSGKHHATLTEHYDHASGDEGASRDIVRNFFEEALA